MKTEENKVTTNGATAYTPRTLPFPHSGFGQDAEWVEANFTNAAEILSAGYPQWVDAQVGVGLTNGLYKLTVSLSDDPPETTFLSVGDLSVAVTNSGDYVFLLEKGPTYDLGFFPASSNITVSAADDAPSLRASWAWESARDGEWSMEAGEFYTDYEPACAFARCWWLPGISGTPDVAHLWPESASAEFSAVLIDCCRTDGVTFEWSAGDGLCVASPDSQTTLVEAETMPDWASASLAVTAWFDGGHVTSWLGFSVGTNAAPQAGISLSVPDVMFANDDDDNNNGDVDWTEAVDFGDDDIGTGMLSFRSDVPTNGTLRIEVGGFVGDVYTNRNDAATIGEIAEMQLEGVVELDVPLYFNAYMRSAYLGASVTATWTPEGGGQVVRTAAFTVVEPVVEPICSGTRTAAALGTNHVYTLNPCAVAAGDDAYFRIEVLPQGFPDSKIKWTHGGGVEFVGGDTGREVHVRGLSACDTSLGIRIGGRLSDTPSFPLKVVSPQLYKITAWIVESEGNEKAREVSDVLAMIPQLNDIYRQVGVSFYLDSVTVTNIPGAYDLLYDSTTNDEWNFDRLVDIGRNTGGIECYFVNSFVYENGDDGVIAANSPTGLVMTAAADVTTLAHEIGHAFGLKDIYVSNAEKDSSIGDEDEQSIGGMLIHRDCTEDDWNGGCGGHGEGGVRYYAQGTLLADVIKRMMMYGVDHQESGGGDITHGYVNGMWYIGTGTSRVWYNEDAPVGFFENMNKKSSPAHQ